MNSGIDFLKSKGIDVDTAVTNMMDVETYNEMMDDFIASIPEELAKIDGFKNSGDMPNYAILVHAMKSNARSFGFMQTGEVAYAHEMASKAGDVNYVNEHYAELLNSVKEMQDIMNTYRSM